VDSLLPNDLKLPSPPRSGYSRRLVAVTYSTVTTSRQEEDIYKDREGLKVHPLERQCQHSWEGERCEPDL